MSPVYSKAYQLTKVLTASHREVVLYLYEGALAYIKRAIAARNEGNVAEAGESIDRLVSILIELSCSLDYSRSGSLALRLDSIYNYLIEVLSTSNGRSDMETMTTCESVLTILGDAWRQALTIDRTAEREEPLVQLQVSA